MKIAALKSNLEDTVRLRQMKVVATGLLLVMALVFCLSSYFQSVHPSLGYVQAFAEAAMIGALADWFAVTALFRHPLGVPIPHTAIVPRRKDEIGDSLAKFIDENFLTADAVSPKLRQINFAENIGSWLNKPENARRLASDCRAMVAWLLSTSDNRALMVFLRRHFNLQLRKVEVTPLLGRVLDLLTQKNHHQVLIDELVVFLQTKLHQHKDQLREKIEAESPWWLPDFVDEKIYEKLVNHLDGTLQRVSADGDHAARKEFDDLMDRTIERFKKDPDTIAQGEAIKQELLRHPSVEQYLVSLGQLLQDSLEEQVNNPDSTLSHRLEQGILRFSEELLQDPDIQRQINDWLCDLVLHVVNSYSQGITSVISDTVRSWDPELTSRRIELSIGRDLQFIRINGTLVGGLVGLLIYSTMQILNLYH